MAITSILRKYADLRAPASPHPHGLHTGKVLVAHWCKCALNRNDTEMPTSADYLNKHIFPQFTGIVQRKWRHTHLFLDSRITQHTVFPVVSAETQFLLFPPRRPLHKLDKLFACWIFNWRGFLFSCSSIQNKHTGRRTRATIKPCRTEKKHGTLSVQIESNETAVFHK